MSTFPAVSPVPAPAETAPILMGIGFACNSKVKKGTAIGVVAGWYVAYKLVGATLAAIFS